MIGTEFQHGTQCNFTHGVYMRHKEQPTQILNGQKFPVMILTNEKQKLSMLNLYQNYDGNQPVIVVDKNLMSNNELKAINTESPFVADKLKDYMKEIMNEALTYLRHKQYNVREKRTFSSRRGQ